MWLKKYFTLFKLSWERVFEYRFLFLVDRFRELILLATSYYLWTNVFVGKENLFGFQQDQILTYIIGTSLLSTVIFSYSMDRIAGAIVDGDISFLLVKPWKYPLLFYFIKRLAPHMMRSLASLMELVVFLLVFKPHFFWQTNATLVSVFLVTLILAVVLFILINFVVGLTSFWTLHAYGPRFALKTAMEFASGRFFPLNILPAALFKLTNLLPFSLLVFFPLNVYLGRLTTPEIYRGLLTQIVWIAILSVVLKIAWQRGLRRYEAVGG